jgi:hypothetical protein
MARTLTDMSGGKIRTLNCSPNIENQSTFNENRPDGSYFFHGPFYEVEPSALSSRGINDFSSGFDVIIEDTTFQMYGIERIEPLLLAKRNLKPGGVFALLEKFAHDDPAEFARREVQKDQEFKSRFFTADQISHKHTSIVAEMDCQLVTLTEMRDALASVFSYGLVTWNSGNFYMILAGDDPDAILNLCGLLVRPAIPDSYVNHRLPFPLFGSFPSIPTFRLPVTANRHYTDICQKRMEYLSENVGLAE